jgi:signal transduction histidine kinase
MSVTRLPGEGQPLFAAFLRDITERKRNEETLKEANQRKDEFLATLAHELRNPLAPLRNGLQVLRLANEDRQAWDQTREMMDRQLGHMVRLVDDLLDLSRISRGKIELRKELGLSKPPTTGWRSSCQPSRSISMWTLIALRKCWRTC